MCTFGRNNAASVLSRWPLSDIAPRATRCLVCDEKNNKNNNKKNIKNSTERGLHSRVADRGNTTRNSLAWRACNRRRMVFGVIFQNNTWGLCVWSRRGLHTNGCGAHAVRIAQEGARRHEWRYTFESCVATTGTWAPARLRKTITLLPSRSALQIESTIWISSIVMSMVARGRSDFCDKGTKIIWCFSYWTLYWYAVPSSIYVSH